MEAIPDDKHIMNETDQELDNVKTKCNYIFQSVTAV